MSLIYLDYNATTPVEEQVLEKMMPWFSQKFGNPASRTHSAGWEAAAAVDLAREQVADLIGASKEEIYFTSGSTEALNIALKGAWESLKPYGNQIITAATEHKAVLEVCRHLESQGAEITLLPVEKDGTIQPGILDNAISPKTILVALMTANNETGVIHPVETFAEICHQRRVWFLTDATQAAGKISIDVQKSPVGMLCLSSHKIYGPKGCGALFVRKRNPRIMLSPVIFGGGHEKGLRPGTLNVPGIVGFGHACSVAQNHLSEDARQMSELRDFLEKRLQTELKATIIGESTNRLPNTSNLYFPGLIVARLLKKIQMQVAVATGSACTSANPEPSHVLTALGLSRQDSENCIRFSLGRMTTKVEIEKVVSILVTAAKKLGED